MAAVLASAASAAADIVTAKARSLRAAESLFTAAGWFLGGSALTAASSTSTAWMAVRVFRLIDVLETLTSYI